MININELKKGDTINYGMFKNVIYEGKDDQYVILKDKSGNTKKVYIELFEKYGRKKGK